ncbi:putative RNA-binding protein [Plasmodium gaboni]|uniref:Putative RNA-binding protein n=1 Tax=Plasmodium gaboni TaxID=647221 RepID=A0A151LNG6_9APIC|nr:putative RNA-binding protein [Plasmodium gaboni]KYO00712.1 putative RNA-binding protein [Plasmodium gaboni]
MLFTKIYLLFVFVLYLVSAFIKRQWAPNNYIYFKTDTYYKRRKKKMLQFRVKNHKDNDIDPYIPYIYKDIAPILKEYADDEYSYKQLVNAYFPETIEREKKMKTEGKKYFTNLKKMEEQKKSLEDSKEKSDDAKKKIDGSIKKSHKSVNKSDELVNKSDESVNKSDKDNKKLNSIEDVEIAMHEKLIKNDVSNFEHISDIKDHKKKNKILDDTYNVIEDSLKDIYMNSNVNKEEDTNNINYIELAKKEKNMLYDKLINNHSMVNDSNTFDLFGVFYDNKNYKDEKKLAAEMNKIINLEPFKSNNDSNLLEVIDTILKKNKIPIHVRNFLMKYRDIAKKISDENEKKNKTQSTSEENDYTDNDINIFNTNDKEKDEKYKEFLKDLNKVIMSIHNNLNNEKLLKREYNFLDELYEDYKHHLKKMHVKRNKLQPQRNNYDFLTFLHEHYEKYYFLKYGQFDYNFNEKINEIKKKIEKDEEQKKQELNVQPIIDHDTTNENKNVDIDNNNNNNNNNKFHSDSKKNGDNDNINDRLSIHEFQPTISSIHNNNNKNESINEIKESKKLKKHIIIDMIRNYEKQMYDIYKPDNSITNEYGFNNYIDNEKYDKEINLTFNKFSILNYDSKEEPKEYEKLYVGKLIFGEIFKIENDFAYVDINYSSYAEIHVDQLPYNISNIRDVFKKKDKLIFEIYKMYPGKILLTLKNIQKINDLNKILLYKTQGTPFDVKVVAILKNGVTVTYNDITSFIHISALSCKYKIKTEQEELEEKINEDVLLNKKIKVFCTDINKLNFSNLIYEQNEQLKILNVYDVLEVDIIHISKYGLMVKYFDVVGLIHVSEISKKKVDNLNDYFKINDKLKGVIVNIDYDNKRFSMSTKILERDGKNIIDHASKIYSDIPNIISDIKKKNTNLKMHDTNIKNQLLSLIDIYKSDKEKKEDARTNEDNKNVTVQMDANMKAGLNEIKEHTELTTHGHNKENIKDINNKEDNTNTTTTTNTSNNNKNDYDGVPTDSSSITKKDIIKDSTTIGNNIDVEKIKQNDEYMFNENELDIYEDEDEDENDEDDKDDEENSKLSIDIHNQMIPYLLMKQEQNKKEDQIEEKGEIVWNLDDDDFVNSNSPTQSSQFPEYQWSYLNDKKWINFSYYINRIMNYYFHIHDDYFTYKEKNVTYEINFAKNIRLDIGTGLYNRIRKIKK